MPTTLRPASAMITVSPANTTAVPGGPDGAGDGVLDVPPFSELGAETGQDEQAVVDADCQAEHRREGDRGVLNGLMVP